MEKCTPAVDAGTNLPAVHITTASFPEAQRYAFWHDFYCNTVYGLDCPSTAGPDFFGEIQVTRVNETKISRSYNRGFKPTKTPHWTRRGSWIKHDRENEISVSLILRGRIVVAQDGREAELWPGDFACFDSARPQSGIGSSEVEHLMLHVPRETWIRRFGPSEKVTARAIRGNTYMGGLVSNFLRQVVPGIGTVDPITANRLVETSLALVATALGNLVSPQELSQSSARISLLYRAKELINENLNDPALNPEKIARFLGISERYLQALFHEEETTMCNWMWQRRLEMCRQHLSDRLLASKSVSQIAFNCGFNNLSHFSRRFKAAFSKTPSEFRYEQLSERIGQ